MPIVTRLAAAVAAVVLIVGSGCATGNVRSSDVRTAFDVQYGIVDDVEALTVESGAASSAVLGGVIGALAAKKHRAAGAAGGAIGAAMVTAMLEGDRRAWAYTVRLDVNRTVKIVIDHGDVKAGQCVAVEQGKSANVRVVSPGHCHPPAKPAAASPEVQDESQADAEACHTAKERVLAATTKEEIELWEHKARILCGH